MKRRYKYHLFPQQEITWVDSDGAKNRVRGLWKTDQFDSELKKWWFTTPELIALVEAKKNHRCDRCGALIAPKRHPISFQIVEPVWYLGIADDCFPHYWGYDYKMCLKCALEVFKNAEVYECKGELPCGWYKKAPIIKEPVILLDQKIREVLGE
jgi:hypothetical protein